MAKRNRKITRKHALLLGLSFYFTSRPCKNNHISLRYSNKGECVDCRKERYEKDKSRYKALNLSWKSKNRKAVYFNNACRRAAKLQATPSWIDFSELKRIYDKRPNGYEVDHIIPLQGKNVCGLHVPWNLQYLKPQENNSKGNRIQ